VGERTQDERTQARSLAGLVLASCSRRSRSRNLLTSSLVHGPLCSPGLSTLFHRCKHCTSFLSVPRRLAILFQFLAPIPSTISFNLASSSGLHFPPTGGLRSARGLSDFLSRSSQFGVVPSSSIRIVFVLVFFLIALLGRGAACVAVAFRVSRGAP